MAKFQKGSKVMREDTQRKGVISQVFDEIRGRQIYLVNWGDSESEALRFIKDEGDFIKGSDWLYYKYTSYKDGYEELKKLIERMVYGKE